MRGADVGRARCLRKACAGPSDRRSLPTDARLVAMQVCGIPLVRTRHLTAWFDSRSRDECPSWTREGGIVAKLTPEEAAALEAEVAALGEKLVKEGKVAKHQPQHRKGGKGGKGGKSGK